MDILIMGGTSFVGKSFALHALERGHRVDTFTRGRTPADYEGVRESLKGDRKAEEDLRQLAGRSYDAVVDFSGYFREDLEKLCAVLDRTRLKRYVFCSTCSVYLPPEREGDPLREDSPRATDAAIAGEYGYNKALAEDFLMASGIPYTIFRPVYIYGEYNYAYREAFLFDSIARGRVMLPADRVEAQFVYVGDLARSFESCLENDAAVCQAYNIAHPEGVLWSRWARAGLAAMGQKAELSVYREKPREFGDRQIFPFEDVPMNFRVEKLGEHGLYLPGTSLEEGMARAYRWYRGIDSAAAVDRRRFPLP